MTPDLIAELLEPYVGSPMVQNEGPPVVEEIRPEIYTKLIIYLELILKWNVQINLTALRTPEEIVRRHFGESLFVAAHLGICHSLLDFGSGAGFPGVPIQLMRPDVKVTLAESRNRKASFLCEVVRSLGLSSEVWAFRVEAMPEQRQFDAVALRAVDDMPVAVSEAARRAREQVLIVGTTRQSLYPCIAENFRVAKIVSLPQSDDGVLCIAHRY